MGRTDGRASAVRATLATSRELFAAAVVIAVVGFAIILRHHWILTRIDWVSLIVSISALAYSFRMADPEPMTDEVFRRDELLSQFAVFVVFLAFYSLTAGSDTSPFNAHVRQAFAFIHGHTYIDAPNYIEHAQVGPYSYQLHPILPAILLMPFTAIWGMDNTNQVYFSIAVGAIDVALAWRLLGRFRLTLDARIWLTFFFGIGTIIWFESIEGSSWAVSMTVAAMLTLLALDETFDQGRPAVVGLYAGIGALARYDLAFVWPVYVGLLWLWRKRSIPELFWFIPGCTITAITYIAFNYARYHSIFDLGVASYLSTTSEAGKKLFALRYLPNNLFTLFFMAPRIDTSFPYIYPTFGGQSILTTSPAFLLAFRASWRRLDVLLVAAGALLAATPVLLYVGNGASQFGTRHFVQAFPFVLLLMALGHRRMDQMARILITISFCLIAWGIWCIRFYGLPA